MNEVLLACVAQRNAATNVGVLLGIKRLDFNPPMAIDHGMGYSLNVELLLRRPIKGWYFGALEKRMSKWERSHRRASVQNTKTKVRRLKMVPDFFY
jgi:hypothetical protein